MSLGEDDSPMRIAFTIILNGKHHLLHNNYYRFMLENFDLWVVSEGASENNGSTSWCKSMGEEFHHEGRSVDGTLEFLLSLQKDHSNLKVVTADSKWQSKDHQVNAAILKAKETTNRGFLWQVDIDEQWDSQSLNTAESELIDRGLKSAGFLSDYYVGESIVAKGEWGEGRPYGLIRLWDWRGELFRSHEPPVLDSAGNFGTLSPRFKHYSYYFEQDVLFKDKWYGGHANIHQRWKTINRMPDEMFPLHISNLIEGPWGKTNTFLYKQRNLT